MYNPGKILAGNTILHRNTYNLLKKSELAIFPGSVRVDDALMNDLASGRYDHIFEEFSHSKLAMLPGQQFILRFRLKDELGECLENGSWVLNTGFGFMDDIRVFYVDQKNDTLVQIDGNAGLNRDRRIHYRHYAFRMDCPGNKNGENEYYILFKPESTQVAPVLYQEPETFRIQALKDAILFSILYGVLLAMAIYNFFIYLSLGERSYLYYVLYMFSFLGFLVCLNKHLLIWSFLDSGTNHLLLWLFLASSVFFSALFVRHFLDTQEHTPFLNRMLYLIQVTSLPMALFALLGWYPVAFRVALVPGTLGPVVGIIIGVVRFGQGFKSARFYLAAWGVSLMAMFFFVTEGIFYLLPEWYNREMFMTLGVALEAGLLSFALGDRIRQLEKEKINLVSLQNKYMQESITDALTGLYNNRYFRHRLNVEMHRAREFSIPLSVLVVDIDHFKRINDLYGHILGDTVLKRVAETLKSTARDNDAVCRYGGEEFVVILPTATLDNAVIVAERMRANVEKLEIENDEKKTISVSISIGVAAYREDENGRDLFQRADRALYEAKNRGRNRVSQNV